MGRSLFGGGYKRGQSNYYLNSTSAVGEMKPGRFPVSFGPRSHSIIEQGMISQLVEAKPEELRVILKKGVA